MWFISLPYVTYKVNNTLFIRLFAYVNQRHESQQVFNFGSSTSRDGSCYCTVLYIQFKQNIIGFLKLGPFSNKTGNVRVNLTLKPVRVTVLVVQISTYYATYSECVTVALVTQHVKCVRRIIWSFVVCLTLSDFSTFSHKRRHFRKNKMLLNLKCVFSFVVQILFVFLTIKTN